MSSGCNDGEGQEYIIAVSHTIEEQGEKRKSELTLVQDMMLSPTESIHDHLGLTGYSIYAIFHIVNTII